MYRARVRLPVELGELLKRDLETAIDQANLGEEDTLIARRYLIDQVPQIDIAVEIGMERSTISRRLPRILDRVLWAAERMGMT